MAWVPVAFLYLLIFSGIASLLVSPVRVVWLAFWVRPLQAKYNKLKGPHGVLPKEEQTSAMHKWMLRQEEQLANTRTMAMVSLLILIFFLETPILFRTYKFPGMPKDLDGINALGIGMASHVSTVMGPAGAIYFGIALALAAGGSLVGVNLLDLVGDILGRPLRMARNKMEDSKKKSESNKNEMAKMVAETSQPEETKMTNFYSELDIQTTAKEAEIAGLLKAMTASWRRKEKAAKLEMQPKARRMLDMIEEAQETLLDADRRRDYDRKIGLRGGGGGAKAGPANARVVGDEQLAQIEKIKAARKAAKAKKAED